jgi:hypothetical protein
VGKLSDGIRENCAKSGSQTVKLIAGLLEDLTGLYRGHIAKEDKQFFIPAMKYFTKQEQDNMLEAFWEFDRMLVHREYKEAVSQLEKENNHE